VKALLARALGLIRRHAAWVKRAWPWLRWALAVAGGALGALIGCRIVRALVASRGPVDTPATWMPDKTDPGRVYVQVSTSEAPVPVVLPPGIVASEIRAVQVVSGGRAIVEVLP
jgi:hypothetical protein